MPRLVRAAGALFIAAHGFAHLVGFVGSWRLESFADAPYTTLILGGALDVGDIGMRVVGVLWLIAALVCLAAAVSFWEGAYGRTALAIAFSLAVCLIGLPAAIIGVIVDLALLAVLATLILVRPERSRATAS